MHTVHPEQRRGLQAGLVAFTLWGLLTIYWKQLGHLDPFEMIGWRIASAAALMLIVGAARHRQAPVWAALGHRPTRRRIVLASILLTVNWATYVWAVTDERVVETALGYFLAPLGTIALGRFVLGEPMSMLQRVSVGSTLIAVAVLTVSYGRLPWVAVAIAATWSVYGLIKRRVPLEPAESLTAELVVVALPAAGLVVAGWFREAGVPAAASGWDWPLILGTGVITAIPLVLFAYAAKRVPFTILGPTNYLVPIINFLLGWLVWNEAMPSSRFVGFGFVWVALALVSVDTVGSRRRARIRRKELALPDAELVPPGP